MKTQKGITLIALIITIIVMLILVGVSVSVALNTGLFKSAQTAAKDTETEKLKETALSNGAITVKVGEEEEPFNSINEYIESLKGEENEGGIKLAETPTYKFYFDNQVFLIDEETTWEAVIVATGDDKWVDTYYYEEGVGNVTKPWTELAEMGVDQYSLSLDTGEWIHARPADDEVLGGENFNGPWSCFRKLWYVGFK